MLRRTSKAPVVLSNDQLSVPQPRLAYGINAPMPHWPLVSMRTTQDWPRVKQEQRDDEYVFELRPPFVY
jgi:hypothetical protein